MPSNTKSGRGSGKSGGTKRSTSSPARRKNKQAIDNPVVNDIILLTTLAVCIVLFLSNFNLAGTFGKTISYVMFGLFGWIEFILPLVIFILTCFITVNKNNRVARIKTIASFMTVLFLCTFFQLLYSRSIPSDMSFAQIYTECASRKVGGGFFGAIFFKLLSPIGTFASFVLVIIFLIITFVVITERSFIDGVKNGSRKMYHSAVSDFENYKEETARRYADRDTRHKETRSNRTSKPAVSDDILEVQEVKTPRTMVKRKGVTSNTKIEDVDASIGEALSRLNEVRNESDFNETDYVKPSDLKEIFVPDDPSVVKLSNSIEQEIKEKEEPVVSPIYETKKSNVKEVTPKEEAKPLVISETPETEGTYKFPPKSLLKRGGSKSGFDSNRELEETQRKLLELFQNFGVKVTAGERTRGPAVTRFEFTPEPGVKVSRIVSLSDDIKLCLAAADIRIEAPVPGKNAVGIEVPNKETSAVMFGDIINSEEFRGHKSDICFAVGKDIGGKNIIADLATMPHVLIAGATGSGKSVCINTIVMSILYKANPKDVKLIMIDPKVVELKIYNTIPHLMIPVVTDCKKAASALNWAVSEMDRRYKLFADCNVRDLKGYNAKVEEAMKQTASKNDSEEEGTKTVLNKLPRVVVVVDEMAELMMVAKSEVESAIVRLAQLARAAGIHLVIATQRPTVNVITGLIKANVPSKIAFAVASGIDSRTIIDRNGAEKLLGKGDMLYYPASLPNPIRVQGAFVSDDEVASVVEYINEHNKTSDKPEFNEEITSHIESGGLGDSKANDDDRDVLYNEAGRFIIEKQKASIGNLQRMYKIGFNRAARIMDQLTDAGVVGPEEGTKPRKILMSMEEFEQSISE